MAYVICVNDAIKAINLGPENQAKNRMNELMEEHKKNYLEQNGSTHQECTYAEIYFWHLHEVPII